MGSELKDQSQVKEKGLCVEQDLSAKILGEITPPVPTRSATLQEPASSVVKADSSTNVKIKGDSHSSDNFRKIGYSESFSSAVTNVSANMQKEKGGTEKKFLEQSDSFKNEISRETRNILNSNNLADGWSKPLKENISRNIETLKSTSQPNVDGQTIRSLENRLASPATDSSKISQSKTEYLSGHNIERSFGQVSTPGLETTRAVDDYAKGKQNFEQHELKYLHNSSSTKVASDQPDPGVVNLTGNIKRHFDLQDNNRPVDSIGKISKNNEQQDFRSAENVSKIKQNLDPQDFKTFDRISKNRQNVEQQENRSPDISSKIGKSYDQQDLRPLDNYSRIRQNLDQQDSKPADSFPKIKQTLDSQDPKVTDSGVKIKQELQDGRIDSLSRGRAVLEQQELRGDGTAKVKQPGGELEARTTETFGRVKQAVDPSDQRTADNVRPRQIAEPPDLKQRENQAKTRTGMEPDSRMLDNAHKVGHVPAEEPRLAEAQVKSKRIDGESRIAEPQTKTRQSAEQETKVQENLPKGRTYESAHEQTTDLRTSMPSFVRTNLEKQSVVDILPTNQLKVSQDIKADTRSQFAPVDQASRSANENNRLVATNQIHEVNTRSNALNQPNSEARAALVGRTTDQGEVRTPKVENSAVGSTQRSTDTAAKSDGFSQKSLELGQSAKPDMRTGVEVGHQTARVEIGNNGRVPLPNAPSIGGNERIDNVKGRGERPIVTPTVTDADRIVVTLPEKRGQENGENDSSPESSEKFIGEKRYITGVEIALAAIIAAGGIRRPNAGDDTVDVVEENLDSAADEELKCEGEEEWFPLAAFENDLSQGAEPDQARSNQVYKRPAYLVGRKESLTAIAEKLFSDPDIAWLIADLNKSAIKDSLIDGKRVVEIGERQKIDLPVWEDIASFYRNKPTYASAKNLVTIIRNSSVDKELMNLMLGAATGCASISANPLTQQITADKSAYEHVPDVEPKPASNSVSATLQHLEQKLGQLADFLHATFDNQGPQPLPGAPADLPSERIA